MAITPTTITTEDQIFLMGSETHLRIRNTNNDSTILSITLELYIWSGNLNTPPDDKTVLLQKSKVSSEDNYIDIQIDELISSCIDKIKFGWVKGDNSPQIAGEGIFFQYKVLVVNESGSELIESDSFFATRGYREEFERVGTSLNNQPYLGLRPINYDRNYSESIKYFKREFDFTKLLADCTSENIIKSTDLIPDVLKCQLGDKWLIVYINRLGLFDYFTPFGKSVRTTDIESEENARVYRNFNSQVSDILHQKRKNINSLDDSYTINTGSLFEVMTEQVEEVIKSPLVYLIEFTGSVFTATQIGITVDSTLVTVDSTIYTVDNQTITADDLGLYDDYKQIPVINTNKSFTKKTRLNDKGKINYDLTFER